MTATLELHNNHTVAHLRKAMTHIESALIHLEDPDDPADPILIQAYRQTLAHLRELHYVTTPDSYTLNKRRYDTYARNIHIYRAVLADIPYKTICRLYDITARRIMQIYSQQKRRLHDYIA